MPKTAKAKIWPLRTLGVKEESKSIFKFKTVCKHLKISLPLFNFEKILAQYRIGLDELKFQINGNEYHTQIFILKIEFTMSDLKK
jgi:hypothetical protein